MKGSSGTEVSPRGPCTVTDVGVLVSVTDGWIWMGFRPTCDIKPCGHAAVELKLRMALGSCDRNIMLGELLFRDKSRTRLGFLEGERSSKSSRASESQTRPDHRTPLRRISQ